MTFWADEEAALLDPEQEHVIRDSKTPSGAVPFSGLRGPIITDALYRTFKSKGLRVRYVFTIDDYDPVDSQSMRQNPVMVPFMGIPLFAVPSPEPGFPDYAKYHATKYLDTFGKLGIRPERILWLRDLYRSGALDGQIDLVLRHADTVRRVYAEVANVQKDSNWLPIAVICENCGRIGTTYAHDYDGSTVAYHCRPAYVTWAEGCNHAGRVSPFGGRSKLYWNLQWCAMWDYFGVTYEEGGKDLLTAGGSRDRANAIFRKVWLTEPPHGLVHEFVTIGGRKVSTSRPEDWQALGVAAHDFVQVYPPELVRFLMLRTDPKRHIEFDPDGMSLPKLMDEYDRCADAYLEDPESDFGRVWSLSQVDESPQPPMFRVRFSVVASWLQNPGVDMFELAAERKGSPLTEVEEIELLRREELAREWLHRWAPPDMRFTYQERTPDFVLSGPQRDFIVEVKQYVGKIRNWEQMQEHLREAAKHHGFVRPDGKVSRDAYEPIYWILLGKPKGPRAGRLLTSLSDELVRRRFDEVLKTR